MKAPHGFSFLWRRLSHVGLEFRLKRNGARGGNRLMGEKMISTIAAAKN
jgi:hypothetical protein